MPGQRRNGGKAACIIMGLAVTLLLSLTLSTQWLVYADRPGKSDIVVLFVGADQYSRRREALQLLQEGYANYFFIPDSFSLYRTGPGRGGIFAIRFSDIKSGINLPGPLPDQEMIEKYFHENWAAYGFPWFYESTHVEMLMAKKTMDACGFKKAIFVSSPYHMKRIKIMADRVFDASYSIKCVPTRFERWNNNFPKSWCQTNYVLMEIPKIMWFISYDFHQPSGVRP